MGCVNVTTKNSDQTWDQRYCIESFLIDQSKKWNKISLFFLKNSKYNAKSLRKLSCVVILLFSLKGSQVLDQLKAKEKLTQNLNIEKWFIRLYDNRQIVTEYDISSLLLELNLHTEAQKKKNLNVESSTE